MPRHGLLSYQTSSGSEVPQWNSLGSSIFTRMLITITVWLNSYYLKLCALLLWRLEIVPNWHTFLDALLLITAPPSPYHCFPGSYLKTKQHNTLLPLYIFLLSCAPQSALSRPFVPSSIARTNGPIKIFSLLIPRLMPLSWRAALTIGLSRPLPQQTMGGSVVQVHDIRKFAFSINWACRADLSHILRHGFWASTHPFINNPGPRVRHESSRS